VEGNVAELVHDTFAPTVLLGVRSVAHGLGRRIGGRCWRHARVRAVGRLEPATTMSNSVGHSISRDLRASKSSDVRSSVLSDLNR
jgi:hypothetical protein